MPIRCINIPINNINELALYAPYLTRLLPIRVGQVYRLVGKLLQNAAHALRWLIN